MDLRRIQALDYLIELDLDLARYRIFPLEERPDPEPPWPRFERLIWHDMVAAKINCWSADPLLPALFIMACDPDRTMPLDPWPIAFDLAAAPDEPLHWSIDERWS